MAAQRIVRTKHQGIYRVHARGCDKDPCRCPDRYQATVYDSLTRRLVRKHFDRVREAQTWRGEMMGAVRQGKVIAPARRTVAEAAEELIDGMRDGTIVNRSRQRYKPAAIRSYERALRLRVLPVFGARRLSDVKAGDVQRFAEGLLREGLKPSTVRNTLDPLRVIYRRAIRLGEAGSDPTDALELPGADGRRTRVESPQRALELIAALPESERAFWAVALFVGLRRGELRALRWSDLDLTSEPTVIRVSRTWDDGEREKPGAEVDAKTEAGVRVVAVPTFVAQTLAAHRAATGRLGDALVFGATATQPFIPSTVRRRARKAGGWKPVANPQAGGPKTVWVRAREDALEPLTPHEARHCAASFLIDRPDVSDLELARAIGHSDVRTTKNIYGHLLPHSGAKIAASMDAMISAASAGNLRA